MVTAVVQLQLARPQHGAPRSPTPLSPQQLAERGPQAQSHTHTNTNIHNRSSLINNNSSRTNRTSHSNRNNHRSSTSHRRSSRMATVAPAWW